MLIKDVGNKLTKLAGVIFVVSIMASVGAGILVKVITGELLFGIFASIGFLIVYMPLAWIIYGVGEYVKTLKDLGEYMKYVD